jgi:hypothetical protein
LSYSACPFFVLDIFKIGSHKLFVQDWLWIEIFLISASWIAGIIGVSHWYLTQDFLFFFFKSCLFLNVQQTPIQHFILGIGGKRCYGRKSRCLNRNGIRVTIISGTRNSLLFARFLNSTCG